MKKSIMIRVDPSYKNMLYRDYETVNKTIFKPVFGREIPFTDYTRFVSKLDNMNITDIMKTKFMKKNKRSWDMESIIF
jgi:hypothetical protein